ncbi:MAG: YIP1 family protein [Candidatus Zixiibacteriota bacterium]
MAEPHAAENAVPDTGSKGLSLRGLWEVFFKPTQFMTELRERPAVLVALVVVVLLSAIFFALMKDIIYDLQVNTPEFQERMRGQALTPGMQQIIKIQTVAFGVIAQVLIPLIAAALGLFWGNFVFAGKASFKQLMAVMTYGTVIATVGMLVGLPIMLAKGTMVPPFGLGILGASQGYDSFLFTLLSKFDVFLFFELAVIGIGLSVLYNVTRSRGIVLSILSMGMLSILHVLGVGIWKLIS